MKWIFTVFCLWVKKKKKKTQKTKQNHLIQHILQFTISGNYIFAENNIN